jgi:DNA-binding MarR family transcriptional regulator
VGGFARARRVGTSTATQTIAALVRKGYLSRTALPEDRRIIRFQVTEAGHQLLQSDNPLRVIAEAIQALPGDERRALAMGLVGLGRRLPAVAPAATGLPVRSGRS